MKIINLKFKISNSKLKPAGFTILEVMLAIALITVIAGIGIPVYQTFQVKNDLDVTVNIWTQTIARAEVLSQGVDGDTTWGVKVQSGNIILFKGASFATRDVDFDESFDVPTSITASGLTEIVFNKFSGFPQSTGTTTFDSTIGESRTVTINSKGTLTY